MSKHILIVGAGLSGVCVATQLIRRNIPVTLLDNEINHSSIIAAGMINPLVFRRMTKSWRVDEFMPYLQQFYQELEQETSGSFFHEIPVRRLFSSEQERSYWEKKQERDDFTAYMHPLSDEDIHFALAKNEFGTGRVKQTYYVDVHLFFEYMKSWLSLHCALKQGEFDPHKLQGTNYDDEEYSDIVFCVGYQNTSIPHFADLPIHQTKGQTLTIKSSHLPGDYSLNRKCFVLPRGGELFKVGATYEWHNPTTHTTEEGKEDLMTKLSYITTDPYTVVDQEAGVRPTTIDRRPILGTHPEQQSYHIFNGLGTKGYMMAPLLSLEFVNFLLDQTPLHEEVKIERFLSVPD